MNETAREEQKKRRSEYLRHWRELHPDYNREWYAAHPDNAQMYIERRRAKRHAQRGQKGINE